MRLFFAVLTTSTAMETALEPAFDRFAGEVARINRERETERMEKEMMAKARLSKGTALAHELSARGERRRMLQMREQELFAQWTSTQKKLELQAKSMMEELKDSSSFVSDTRKSLDAAKSERAAQLQRAEDIDGQRRRLMEKRRDLLQERSLIAAQLETLAGNMTVLDAAKQKALQAAVQQADAVSQEEAQLASLESESSKERGELWNLDVRLATLSSRLNQTLAKTEGRPVEAELALPVLVPSPAPVAPSPSPAPVAPSPSPASVAPSASPKSDAHFMNLVRGFAPTA